METYLHVVLSFFSLSVCCVFSLIRSPSGGGIGHSRSSSLCSVRSQCLTAAVNGCVHVTHRCLARLHTLRLDHNRLGEVTLGQADRPDGGGDVRQTLQWSDSDVSPCRRPLHFSLPIRLPLTKVIVIYCSKTCYRFSLPLLLLLTKVIVMT